MPAKKSQQGQAYPVKAGHTRVSFILPNVLDENFELLCSIKGLRKQEGFTQALAEFLQREGIRPDRKAKIKFFYEE